MSIGIYLSFPFSINPVNGLEWGDYLFTPSNTGPYLAALLTEIEHARFQRLAVSSLLLGAGDWALVPDDYLAGIIKTLRKKFNLWPGCEFTLEMTPTALCKKSIKFLKEVGINRVSLNLFSNKRERLENLVKSLFNVGIKNLNLDLYFGKPGQSLKKWQEELQFLTELKPAHISLYSFGSGNRQAKLKQELYSWALNYLFKKGYRQYEICHFCSPGFESKQNLIYWNRKNFIGFGAGASSLWNNRRWKNPRPTRQYIKSVPLGRMAFNSARGLTRKEELEETVYYALRQMEGLNLSVIRKTFGINLYENKRPVINALIENDYLTLKRNRLTLTKEGYLNADELISKLF